MVSTLPKKAINTEKLGDRYWHSSQPDFAVDNTTSLQPEPVQKKMEGLCLPREAENSCKFHTETYRMEM